MIAYHEIQHMLQDMNEESMSEKEPKQKRPGTVMKTIEFNGRKATTTKGAIALLKELTDHEYSRDSIYRMYVSGKLEGERTDIANFYYIDSIRRLAKQLRPLPGKERVGRKSEQSSYSPETRAEALRLREQGMSYGKIATQLGVTSQIVQYWVRHQRISNQS